MSLDISRLVDNLLAVPEVRKAMREYYRMTLSLRHFFRSHFAFLAPGMRDYDLPPEGLLGALEEDLEMALKQDIQAREPGGRTQTGSKTFSRVKITDEVRDSLKAVIWDEKQEEYRPLLKGEKSPKPSWYNSKFPDPFLYFGLKHMFKKWHTTRILNAFQATRAIAMKKGSNYPLGIGAQAKKWVAAWEISAKNDATIYTKILDLVNASPLALVDFITEARLPPIVLETLILNLPDNLSDFNLVRNRCRALRNKYDAQSKDSIGVLYNRKKWIGRISKLRDFLLRPYGNTASPATGTPPPAGQDKTIETLGFSPLLIYLAYPTELAKIEPGIPAKFRKGIKRLSNWIVGDQFKQGRVRSLGRLYPSIPEVLDLGKGIAEEEGYVPPLTSHDLLRAVMQALVITVRQEYNAVQKDAPKKTRRLKYLRSLEARLINLVYAHLYFGTNAKDAFGFLANPPAFFPGQDQAKLLAAQVLSVLQKDKVRTKSMAGKNPENKSWFDLEVARFSLPEEDEDDTKDLLLKGGFQACISRIIQVLVTIRVVGVPVESLREFVTAAQNSWDSHLGSSGVGDLDPFGKIFANNRLNLPKIGQGPKWVPNFMPLALSGGYRSNGIGNIDNLYSSVTPAVQKGKHIEYWLVGPPMTKDDLVGKKSIPVGKKQYLPTPEWDVMFSIGDKIEKRGDPLRLNEYYKQKNNEEITGIEGEITEIDNRLALFYPAERNLIALRRKAIIWYFLCNYIDSEVSLEDDPNIIDLLQKHLQKKQARDLSEDEVTSLKKFVEEGEITADAIGTFISEEILPVDTEHAFLMSAWFTTYEDVCDLLEIDSNSQDYANIDGEQVTKFLGAVQKVAKVLDSAIKIDGSRRMSLVNGLQHAWLEGEILSREVDRLKEKGNKTGATQKANPRARFRRALEYLEKECKKPDNPLYKFVNDERGILCEVVVPLALRTRIAGGAFVDSIQLLPPTKGYRVMANISVKGKREIVRTLAKFARVVVHLTINIIAGGCIGLDQNRIYYPRAFAHARVGVKDGDLEPKDIPGIDLALLLDLVKFALDDAGKVSGCRINVFNGNEKDTGPFHIEEGAFPAKVKTVAPALSYLGKIRRAMIDGGQNPLPDLQGFPLAASAEESCLTMPAESDPLNMYATSRKAGFSDQIGAPQAFWGVKRIHMARKIRYMQQLTRSTRFRISERKDGDNEKSRSSTLNVGETIARYHRQLTDITYREQRNESLRKCIGEYLSRTVTYILSIIKDPIAYSAEKLSLAVEGKRGGLADIIKQMFKNLGLMWRKAARRVVDAGVPTIPPYSEVAAAGTSKYCYACGMQGFTGIIDRRVSADFGHCKRCGVIVDCHLNAAKNIAALHPRCTKEKGTGGVFKVKVKKKKKKKGEKGGGDGESGKEGPPSPR